MIDPKLKEKLKPYIEGLKEIARWLLLFIASWIITETLNQLGAVPEKATVKIWVFNYIIPIRLLVNTLLTFLGRFIDKSLHEIGKAKEEKGTVKKPITSALTGGLTRF